MPTVITATEYLSFNAIGTLIPAVPLNTPGWAVVDYTPLYQAPPKIGDDRVIPGTSGRLGVAREFDEMQVSLAMNIYGARDHENTAASSRPVGLRNNMDYLRSNVVNTIDARAVTFHKQAGGTLTGSVYVEELLLGEADPTGALCRAVLRITIPAGTLS